MEQEIIASNTDLDLHNSTQNRMADTRQYLTFCMGNEEYGVNILKVMEIKAWSHAIPLPRTPKYVKGIMNLRGVIVPIIDLRQRFNLTPSKNIESEVVIVIQVACEDHTRSMGIIVDAVSDVHNIMETDLLEAPKTTSAIDNEYIDALVNVNNKMIVLLNTDAMLHIDAIA
ncbi:MAG: chemotaxis protein CheW [Gammaproteobacteria bacterium]